MKHVFENLPQQYKWVAVDSDGSATAFTHRPEHDDWAWIPPVGCSCVPVSAVGMEDATRWRESLVHREAPEFPQLQQDITARQHYAFELLKIALTDNPMLAGENLGNAVNACYAVADRFLKAGDK